MQYLTYARFPGNTNAPISAVACKHVYGMADRTHELADAIPNSAPTYPTNVGTSDCRRRSYSVMAVSQCSSGTQCMETDEVCAYGVWWPSVYPQLVTQRVQQRDAPIAPMRVMHALTHLFVHHSAGVRQTRARGRGSERPTCPTIRWEHAKHGAMDATAALSPRLQRHAPRTPPETNTIAGCTLF